MYPESHEKPKRSVGFSVEETPLISSSSSKSASTSGPSPTCSGTITLQQVEGSSNTHPRSSSSSSSHPSFFRKLSKHWIPEPWELVAQDESASLSLLRNGAPLHHRVPVQRERRSIKRRTFLFLTEPDTSIASAAFFFVLILSISLLNLVMMMQTMEHWQYVPDDCRTCGGAVSYVFDDDSSIANLETGIVCECPPTPMPWTVIFSNYMVYFFTAEWTLRVLTFEPPRHQRSAVRTKCGFLWQWLDFLSSTTTVLDALAIFPYYIEMTSFKTNGLMSLRLLRLFRVFQLVRLGQYNETFLSLSTVLFQSVPYLKLLMGVLIFGAAFFGSIMYWLEKGDWMYLQETGTFEFVRTTHSGAQQVSPFTSIPAAFWWFVVTATTVGYGDVTPTTAMGKIVASMAMLVGVLVIAFPVSVFSDLWSKELRRTGAIQTLDEDEDDGAGNDTTGSATAISSGSGDTLPAAAAPAMSTSASDSFNYESSLDNMNNMGVSRPVDYASSGTAASFVENDHVVIRKDDLVELAAQLHAITESQRQIRSILKKYRVPNHPHAT